MSTLFKTSHLFYQQSKVWLHIALTYVFIHCIFATLICTYLQEVNQNIITGFLILGSFYGFFKAEKIRKSVGLLKYQSQLKTID